MYQVVKSFNPETLLAQRDGRYFVLKKIDFDDIDVIKRLMTLNNRNVVRFIELITIGNEFFCVEEYIDGITLDEYLHRYGALSDERAKQIVYEICLGLKDIHSLGIVHRDINPSNIMIDRFETVKIIDFGISRTNKIGKSSDTHILGTYGFAAPEQFGFSQTSTKSDIYSLGVLINYLKTMALPNQAKADGLLGEIVEKCTRIDESKRYNSVDEIINAIISGKAESKKNKFALPGFRQGKRKNMIIASIYYIITIFILCMFVFDPDNIYESIYFSLFDIFLLIIPVFIFGNYLGWADNLKASKNHSKRFVCNLYGIMYEIIVFMVFIIVDYPK